ncbi:MAG TPA: hypothetical protein VGI40_11730 [Pirellulaceae bacterium]
MPVLSTINGPPSAIFLSFALGIVGCVLAQGNLLAAWLAWSEGPFLRRLVTHWKIAAFLYFVWLLGFGIALGRNQDAFAFAATVALGVPLVSFAAQLPLWAARHWFGWRLVKADAVPAERPDPPLTIRDLMLATFIVAVSLALARLAPADGKDVWPVWAVAFITASLISSISLLPAGALLLRDPLFLPGLLKGGLYAASLIALEWVFVASLWWRYPAALGPGIIYVAISSLMFSFAATLLLTAALAHNRNYRLVSRRRSLVK